MQDHPSPEELLGSVIAFLRETVVVEVKPRTAFQARVAANALELVRRQIQLGERGELAERERLKALLQSEGSLSELNDRLANALAKGELSLMSPGVRDHLLQTAIEKLAVDQPAYSGYRAALGEVSTTQEEA